MTEATYRKFAERPAYLAHYLVQAGSVRELAEKLDCSPEVVYDIGSCLLAPMGLDEYATHLSDGFGVDKEKVLNLLTEMFPDGAPHPIT